LRLLYPRSLSPVLIVVVAFPIVAAGIWLIDHALPYLWHLIFAHRVLHNPAHLPARLDWLGTYLAGYPWQPAVVGILAVHPVRPDRGTFGTTVAARRTASWVLLSPVLPGGLHGHSTP
jgi:hypothetical protein